MTQANRIAMWFVDHEELSREQALLVLRINNVTAVISDMRKAGYDIETVEHKSINGARYATWARGATWQKDGCLPKQ